MITLILTLLFKGSEKKYGKLALICILLDSLLFLSCYEQIMNLDIELF
jgi:hypothetical protein